MMYDDAFKRLMSRFNAIPRLSREEETTLIRRWQQHQDQKAYDTVLNANLRYVGEVAYNYRGGNRPLEDLVAEGTLGLIYALSKFDPEKGFRFVTYSQWWVRCYLTEYLDRVRTITTTTRSTPEVKLAWTYMRARAKARLVCGDDSAAIEEYVAAKCDCSVERVRMVLDWADSRTWSLDCAIKGQTMNEQGSTLGEMIPSLDPSPEEALAEADDQALRREVVAEVLRGLDDEEMAVIEGRYMRDPDDVRSFPDIGRQFGYTRQRAQQIDVIVRRKLAIRLASYRGIIPV